MPKDPMVLLGCMVAATIVMLGFRRLMRHRRDILTEFERAIGSPDAVYIEEYRYGDESETATSWSIKGTAGEFSFSFEAIERRKGQADPAIVWFTLGLSRGVAARFDEYGFGGECQGSKGDQSRLRRLFTRLWPDGHYPPPDTRPERARMFAPRSS